MSDQDLPARLRAVFVEALDDSEVELDPALSMGDLEAWDSFAHINLMLGIEATFGVEFDSEEIGSLLSVGQILEALRRRLEAAGS